jgi:hypothetical protein
MPKARFLSVENWVSAAANPLAVEFWLCFDEITIEDRENSVNVPIPIIVELRR